MSAFLQWCHDNALSEFMRSAKWPFPTVEIFHIAGLILIFGSVLVLNLRIFVVISLSFLHCIAEVFAARGDLLKVQFYQSLTSVPSVSLRPRSAA